MDVKQAVATAKAYVADVFSDERPTNIGLEEIVFDENADAWKITIGFSRPWTTTKSAFQVLSAIEAVRTFKVLTISNDDGRVVSMTAREAA